MNRVLLLGHVGSEPEERTTRTGTTMVNFSVATTERWTDDRGEQRESTEWTRVVAFGGTAERAGEVRQGDRVHVEGKLQTRKYAGRDGVEKQSTSVVASRVWRLVTRDDRPQAGGQPPRRDAHEQRQPPPGARVVDRYSPGPAPAQLPQALPPASPYGGDEQHF